jgi:hypothetical protein
MRDFRVVQSKAALRVTSISPVRGFDPPSIIVLGEKFQLAEQVLYNGIDVPEFVIASQTRIVARIPDALLGLPMTGVSVMTSVPAANSSSLLSLGLSRLSRSVAGMDKLVQDWMLLFMTTPGSDIFDPSLGGGGQQVVGKAAGPGGSGASAELSLAVSRTREQLLSIQAKSPRIPPAERLLSASLVSVRFDEMTTTLTAVVDIRNMVGASASVR